MIELIQKYPVRTVALLLVALTLAAYWPVIGAGFADYDDTEYIIENHRIQGGLTLSGLVWALGAFHYGTWQPFTWLSFMLDIELYGLTPQGFHFTNLLLHLASMVILLILLHRMTGHLGRSALVAGLFALHPLHVESVAWIAERKDVLSTCCGMLAMLAWVRYTEAPGAGRYLQVFVALTLGLMAKPMLVTLPLLLLLLDHWPLGRLFNPKFRWRVVAEKLPLLFLSAGSSLMTWLAHHSGGGIRTMAEYPLLQRLPQAISSYGWYLWKTIWPTDLAVLYPISGVVRLRFLDVLPSALVLILIFGAMILVRIRRNGQFAYLETGWLWFLGSLVPVIGLVQFGSHARADRFSYIPLIGLFIIVAWGGHDLFRGLFGGGPSRRLAGLLISRSTLFLTLITIPILLVLAAGTWVQAGYWHSSETLFRHALEVTGHNHVAHNMLGKALVERGTAEDALEHFQQAVALRPTVSHYHQNLAIALQRSGRLDAAAAAFREAIRLDPGTIDGRSNLGLVLFLQGQQEEALTLFRETTVLAPGDPRTHYALGVALQKIGRHQGSIPSFLRTLQIDPEHHQARVALAQAYHEAGRFHEAWQEVNRCKVRGLTIDPAFLEKLSADLNMKQNQIE